MVDAFGRLWVGFGDSARRLCLRDAKRKDLLFEARVGKALHHTRERLPGAYEAVLASSLAFGI